MSLMDRVMFLITLVLFSTPLVEARETVDLIVAGDYVVPMDDVTDVIRDGAVAIRDGRIQGVGSAAEIKRMYKARRNLPGKGRVVMPGLINGHTHAAMSLLRGIADDLELMDWLNNFIFPVEARFVNPEFVRVGTELACWEMIRGGTTTLVDMYYFADSTAQALEDCGLRAMVSTTAVGQKTPDAENVEDSLNLAASFVERWQRKEGKSGRIIPILAPHSVYTLNPDQLTLVMKRALELKVPVSIHLAESPFEIEVTRKNYGTTPIKLLDQMGFFEVPTIAAHVVWPTIDEIPILARRRVGVIHNPTSNMKIASGVAPIQAMLDAGVAVGLGTDGAASNNDLDMWEEMRLAAFLAKVSGMNPKALPARTVLRMATRGGAEAIGLSGQIGSLKAGYKADLIQVSLQDAHFIPTYDVISHLVYVADEQDVETVIVDGRVLMRNGKIRSLDITRVRREAEHIAAEIRQSFSPP